MRATGWFWLQEKRQKWSVGKMAGTLTEGVQYGLSSNGLPSENKSLVYVKLTDSSFKAIEEYLRIKVRTERKAKKWNKNN